MEFEIIYRRERAKRILGKISEGPEVRIQDRPSNPRRFPKSTYALEELNIGILLNVFASHCDVVEATMGPSINFKAGEKVLSRLILFPKGQHGQSCGSAEHGSVVNQRADCIP